jgi:hypothetical protein
MHELNVINGHTEQEIIGELANQFAVAKGQSVTENLIFYDSYDWRLFRASLILARSKNEFILRSLANNEVLQRQVVADQPKFVWDLPAGPLRRQLEPILQMRALLKYAEVDLESTSYRILNNDEKTVVRVIYEALVSTDQAADLAAVEHLFVTPVRGYDKQALNVSHMLETAGLVEDQDSLYANALTLSDRTPGDYTSKLDLQLDPQMRADEATRLILRRLVEVMKANEAGIKQDIDTEFLHDFRVAVRRTRSALSQVKGIFPEETTRRFKADFARIGQLTNDLRDLDVYLLAEDSYKAMLPDIFRDDINPLFDYLKQKRAKALSKTIAGLNDRYYAETLLDWQDFLYSPPANALAAPNSALPVIDLARRIIYKRYRRVVTKS